MAENIKLSVIMPVYNERKTILEIIRQVQAQPYDKEIIIIDDCSDDGTKELLRGLAKGNVKVTFNGENHGKGYGIRKGLEHVTGDIVIIQDADLEYYPDEYGLLIEKIIQGKADVVYGSRFLGARRIYCYYHYLGNMTITCIANILLGSHLTDLMTCYKAFRTSAIKQLTLQANRFGTEAEITAEVFKAKYRVSEVPISYNARARKEGKKITWLDFFGCLYWLIWPLMRGVKK